MYGFFVVGGCGDLRSDIIRLMKEPEQRKSRETSRDIFTGSTRSQIDRGPVSPLPGLDEIDQGIIATLQEDGRKSFRSIAAQIGVSEGTVRTRYAKLHNDNVLRVTGITNPLSLGFDAMAMIGVKTSGPPGTVADALATWKETSYVVIAAGQFDLLVELVCFDRGHLLEVINRIRELSGVVSTESFIYLDLYKQLYNWGVPRR